MEASKPISCDLKTVFLVIIILPFFTSSPFFRTFFFVVSILGSSTNLLFKNLTSSNLQKLLIKLIENKKFKKNLQKKIYNHFYLTNESVSKKIDRYRKNLIRV